jgi:phospholipase C
VFFPRSAAALGLLALLGGCSSSESPATGATSSSATGSGGAAGSGGAGGAMDHSPGWWNQKVTPPSDADAAAGRIACKFKKNALPAATQGKSFPMGDQIPVDTIVIMMLENRSFDHYFQAAPSAGIDVEVAPSDFANPDPDGVSVPMFRDTTMCFVDPDHGWSAVHAQIDGGKMDGFVTSNDATHETPIPGIPLAMMKGDRAMGYYTEDDIPFTYWLAKHFAIGDHYHASVPGPTWPNRMYLYAASSFGRTDNTFPENVDATLMDYLTTRGVEWKIYRSETPCYGIFPDRIIEAIGQHRVVDLSEFEADAKKGTLPPVVFVDAGFSIDDANSYTQEDEHPPGLMQFGQRSTAGIVNTLMASPQWKRSAMFITYDEHGGLFDHVVPPKACPPDDRPAENAAPGEGFDQLGIRVPFIVVSPWAKNGFVGHHVYDHTSIVRFVESRFTLPALSGRDANAEAPWEMFDFTSAPNESPPAAPVPTVDAKKKSACQKLWNP